MMPHVTGCLPSVMPGRGTVDRGFWDNRQRDPVRARECAARLMEKRLAGTTYQRKAAAEKR